MLVEIAIVASTLTLLAITHIAAFALGSYLTYRGLAKEGEELIKQQLLAEVSR